VTPFSRASSTLTFFLSPPSREQFTALSLVYPVLFSTNCTCMSILTILFDLLGRPLPKPSYPFQFTATCACPLSSDIERRKRLLFSPSSQRPAFYPPSSPLVRTMGRWLASRFFSTVQALFRRSARDFSPPFPYTAVWLLLSFRPATNQQVVFFCHDEAPEYSEILPPFLPPFLLSPTSRNQ